MKYFETFPNYFKKLIIIMIVSVLEAVFIFLCTLFYVKEQKIGRPRWKNDALR